MISEKTWKYWIVGFVMLIFFIGFIFVQQITEKNEEAVAGSGENFVPEEKSLRETRLEENIQNNPPVKDQPPILKNLGVNIDYLNEETNLAGDLIFTKKLIYDDGHISNDKVFIEFGDSGKNLEIWFFVPLKTNLRAPVDGRVSLSFFNHTNDWGINIMQEDSKWITSFEHVVNLIVKDGDIVKAGDIVGEASPRNTFNNEIAMVELVVWTGGNTIIKYCPFLFLESSLKPTYEQKLRKIAGDWEEFISKNVYQEEEWVAPGCLLNNITEKIG